MTARTHASQVVESDISQAHETQGCFKVPLIEAIADKIALSAFKVSLSRLSSRMSLIA